MEVYKGYVNNLEDATDIMTDTKKVYTILTGLIVTNRRPVKFKELREQIPAITSQPYLSFLLHTLSFRHWIIYKNSVIIPVHGFVKDNHLDPSDLKFMRLFGRNLVKVWNSINKTSPEPSG